MSTIADKIYSNLAIESNKENTYENQANMQSDKITLIRLNKR